MCGWSPVGSRCPSSARSITSSWLPRADGAASDEKIEDAARMEIHATRGDGLLVERLSPLEGRGELTHHVKQRLVAVRSSSSQYISCERDHDRERVPLHRDGRKAAAVHVDYRQVACAR